MCVVVERASVDIAELDEDPGGCGERRFRLLVRQGVLAVEDAAHGVGVEAAVVLGAGGGLGEGLIAVAVGQAP